MATGSPPPWQWIVVALIAAMYCWLHLDLPITLRMDRDGLFHQEAGYFERVRKVAGDIFSALVILA